MPAPSRARHARFAAGSLFLGVVTTLAVAWVSAAIGVDRNRMGMPSVVPLGDGFVVTAEMRGLLGERRESLPPSYTTEPDKMFPRRTPPSWAAIRSSNPYGGVLAEVSEAHGWPWRALTFGVDRAFGDPASRTWHGALPLRTTTDHEHALPLRPLWGGLAGDAAVFGFIWWALLSLASHARRRGRIAHGRCESCGYDRHDMPAAAPCPECGRIPA